VSPTAHFSQQFFFFASGGVLSANSGRKFSPSKPPRFIRHRRRFGGFRKKPFFWISFPFKSRVQYGPVKGIDSAIDPLPLPLR
jgi:hypothetical protein